MFLILSGENTHIIQHLLLMAYAENRRIGISQPYHVRILMGGSNEQVWLPDS